MTRAELRRAMRQRKAELKAALGRARRENRARLEQNPIFRKQRKRRRVRDGVIAALALLFLLLWRCDCANPPPPVAEPRAQPAEQVVPPPTPKPPAPKAKRVLKADMESQQRGGYAGEGRAPVTWVDDFRLQVAARSQRLASCFTGREKPGALRWTTSINAESGAVFDHEIDALASSAPLGTRERDCVIAALSTPPYKLEGVPAPPQGIPNRVSIVIEF